MKSAATGFLRKMSSCVISLRAEQDIDKNEDEYVLILDTNRRPSSGTEKRAAWWAPAWRNELLEEQLEVVTVVQQN